jgi:predicted transcriptional regulator
MSATLAEVLRGALPIPAGAPVRVVIGIGAALDDPKGSTRGAWWHKTPARVESMKRARIEAQALQTAERLKRLDLEVSVVVGALENGPLMTPEVAKAVELERRHVRLVLLEAARRGLVTVERVALPTGGPKWMRWIRVES